MKYRFRKFLLWSATAGLLIAASLFVLLKMNPVAFRTWIFQPVREASYFVYELDAVTDWGGIQRIELPEPEIVTLPAQNSREVDIVAGLYRPQEVEPAMPAMPAIVLLHGSAPWGRKAGLVRLLATRLAAKGFFVLAPDARGFGDSEDPISPDMPESWATASDLSRMVDFLVGIPNVDHDNVFVLGHSLGANYALEGGLPEARVKALVLIGPGRYPSLSDIDVSEWQRARFSSDRGLRRPIPVNVARYAYTLGNIRTLAETELASPTHKPILLIDGEKEGRAKLNYLEKIVSTMSGPIEYHTLKAAGHYCGVRSFYGSETVYYRPSVFDPFFSILLDFLERQQGNKNSAQPD